MARRSAGGRTLRYVAFLLAAWFVLVGAIVGSLLHAQAGAREDERAAFSLRVSRAATVAGGYVDQLLARQAAWAQAVLSGKQVAQSQAELACATIGFTHCGVVDAQARVLMNTPYVPQNLGRDFSFLQQVSIPLRTGQPYVTPVYFAPEHEVPVVALGTPYDTPYGRRVLTGVFMVQESDLLDRLRGAVAMPGTSIYVVDTAGNVAARSTGTLPAEVTALRTYAPLLADRLPSRAGTVGRDYFASATIPATPWRLVATVPTNALYEPESGFAQAIWWIVAVGSILGIISIWALVRAVQRQAQSQARADLLEAEIETRRRYAHEVNDAIVQGLVAAETAYDLGRHEYARELVGQTSRRARDWIGELLQETGLPEPPTPPPTDERSRASTRPAAGSRAD